MAGCRACKLLGRAKQCSSPQLRCVGARHGSKSAFFARMGAGKCFLELFACLLVSYLGTCRCVEPLFCP